MDAKEAAANAVIGASAVYGFLANAGQPPTTGDLADAQDAGNSRLETSVGEYRGDNEAGTSGKP